MYVRVSILQEAYGKLDFVGYQEVWRKRRGWVKRDVIRG